MIDGMLISLLLISILKETYHRMELEKKKARVQKQVYRGPVIRYQSVTMPLIEDLSEAEINVEESSENNGDK